MLTTRRTRPIARRGMTLVETTMALATMVVIMGAVTMAARIMVVGAATLEGRVRTQAEVHRVVARMRDELRLATTMIELAPTAVAFTCPDLDGDGTGELIRYAWSGTSAAPLTRQVNGGDELPVLGACGQFALMVDTEAPGQPAASDGYGLETLLAEHNHYPDGQSYVTKNQVISAMEWGAQAFTPTQAGATKCVVTRILFSASVPDGTSSGAFCVSLHEVVSGTLAPKQAPLAQVKLPLDSLTVTPEWREVVFKQEPEIRVGTPAAVVVGARGQDTGFLAYQILSDDEYVDTNSAQYSPDAGRTWTPGAQQNRFDFRFQVFGRFLDAEVPVPPNPERSVRLLFISVESGAGSSRSMIAAAVECLNRPSLAGVAIDESVVRSAF